MAVFDEIAAKLSPYIDGKLQTMVADIKAENKKTNDNINLLREQMVKAGLIK